jgi:NHLM bacteriocin system ABC transporter ATP-binding protein
VPTCEERGSPRRFPIHEVDRFWIVESGKLDLFAVERADSGQTGGNALRHILRLEAGQAVFAVQPDLSSLELIASMGPNTTLKVCSIAKHEELARGQGADAVLLRLLEGWITNLSTAIIHEGIPTKYLTVEPGDGAETADDKSAILPSGEVSWIEPAGGRALFLGHESAAVPEHSVFPVTRAGWIEIQPGTRIVGIESKKLIDNDLLVRGVRAFHSLILGYLESSLASAEEKEQERLARKAQNDVGSLRWALSELASPLRQQRESVASGEVLNTPLFKVFQAIGRELDIEFKPHPDLLRGKPVSDPVAAIARASGVRIRRVALQGQWWREGDYPLLAWRDSDEQPMALLPNGRGFTVYESQQPEKRALDAATVAALHPFAYTFYRPFPDKSIGVFDLVKFGLKGCRPELSWILLMGIASGLLATAVPFATGIIFDSLIPGAERSELLLVCSVLLAIAVTSSLCTLVRESAVLRLEGKMDVSIQAAVWDRLLSLPVRFFRDYASGDLADRSLGIAQIRHVLTSTTLASILSGFFSIFSAALLFYYSPRLALIGVGLTATAFLITIIAACIELQFQRHSWSLSGLISGIVLEFITGVAKLRVAGAENRAFVVWVKHFSAQKRADRSARRVSSAVMVFNAIYPVLCLAVIFVCYRAFQTQTDGLSTGQLLAFVAAFTQFLGAVLNLGGSLVSVLSVVPLYERAAPIVKTRPEVGSVRSDPGELDGRIEATHLTFRYRPDTPLVIHDLSFRIDPGQFIAFVGPSGCGKSTLLRLLLGFDEPESGAVFYDGQDLAGLDVQALRRRFGVVLQSSTLTTGTILENIIGVASNLGADEAMNASRMAGLDQDIRRLPMGLHTHIREGGVGLSGGQRQRILIARAIVARPRIMLFDEASSALDNKTQAIVSESLKSLKSTRIVIAHRLSTIVDADRILVMERGRIVQQGRYDQLIKEGGMFGELARRQIA